LLGRARREKENHWDLTCHHAAAAAAAARVVVLLCFACIHSSVGWSWRGIGSFLTRDAKHFRPLLFFPISLIYLHDAVPAALTQATRVSSTPSPAGLKGHTSSQRKHHPIVDRQQHLTVSAYNASPDSLTGCPLSLFSLSNLHIVLEFFSRRRRQSIAHL